MKPVIIISGHVGINIVPVEFTVRDRKRGAVGVHEDRSAVGLHVVICSACHTRFFHKVAVKCRSGNGICGSQIVAYNGNGSAAVSVSRCRVDAVTDTVSDEFRTADGNFDRRCRYIQINGSAAIGCRVVDER